MDVNAFTWKMTLAFVRVSCLHCGRMHRGRMFVQQSRIVLSRRAPPNALESSGFNTMAWQNTLMHTVLSGQISNLGHVSGTCNRHLCRAQLPEPRLPLSGSGLSCETKTRVNLASEFLERKFAGGHKISVQLHRGRQHVAREAGCQCAVSQYAADSRDWEGSNDYHKKPPKIFYSKKGEKFLFQAGEKMELVELPEGTRVIYPGLVKDGVRGGENMRAMVQQALDSPVGTQPLRDKLRALKAAKSNPKIVFAFDDVSIPLPPMESPDIRQLIMEQGEAMCMEENIVDIQFICSIALHRYIRPDEFQHICGPRLYGKYFPDRMRNYNAVDKHESVHIGYTRHGEDVEINKWFAEADLVIYANVNYVSMDGGYKSYATGMVHYNSLKHNHDSKTLRATRSLYDPPNSAMHKSFNRIGKMMQKHTDVFHVETVLDDQLFPFLVAFVMTLDRDMSILEKILMYVSVYGLKVLPLWLRKFIFWFNRGPFGLIQVTAGETQAVHERTLETIYRSKIVDVQGQADILILGPSCLGPYTKDMYLNPLLVNTYSLGYYYNMYVDGVPLVKDGGVVIVVSEMHYSWSSPAHDGYRELFEEVIKVAPGLDEFEAYQERFASSERLNDIYRSGQGPAGVHGFYMYTWAAHGMDKVGKVYVVGATDPRGPEILRWEMAPSVIAAVDQAKAFLDKPDASVTFFRCPPVGYVRVKKEELSPISDVLTSTVSSPGTRASAAA